MNWDAVGAIGEILGATAVVATLLYLARQTRISGQAAISTSRSASTMAIAEFDRDVAGNPELAKILQRSFETPKADYNELEWLRFMTLARSLIYLYEDSYIQSVSGTTDPEAADIHVAAVIALIEHPAWNEFWTNETRGDAFRKAFVEAVNGSLASARISGAVIAGRPKET